MFQVCCMTLDIDRSLPWGAYCWNRQRGTQVDRQDTATFLNIASRKLDLSLTAPLLLWNIPKFMTLPCCHRKNYSEILSGLLREVAGWVCFETSHSCAWEQSSICFQAYVGMDSSQIELLLVSPSFYTSSFPTFPTIVVYTNRVVLCLCSEQH